MIAKSLTTNHAQEQSASVDAVTWLRLGSLAAAFTLSAYGYRNHRYIDEWWYWVGDLVLAAALLCFALADDTKAPESTLRRTLRHACGLVSIVSWAAAIYYGGQQGSELEAGIATLAALITFFVARWVPVSDRDALCLNSGSDIDAWALTGSSWVIGAAGLATAMAAAAVNLSYSVAGFALWLAALVLFAVAAQRGGKGSRAAADCAWREEAGPQLPPGIALVAVAAVLFIAIALRVPLLDQYPAYINSDEGRLGHSALKQFEDGFPNMFGMGWNAFPNISTVADVLPIKVLGMDIAHLRLSSAIFGVASILATYFWARRWWGNIVALLAMLILSFNQEHINWSRIGMNNIQQVLVGMLMLAAMARALQTRRPLDWVWFGYATGLSFLTYHAAKLFPALLFGVMVLFAISMRGFARRNFAGALIALAAFFVILAPHLTMLYLDWSNFYAGTSNRVDLGVLFDAYRAGDVYAVRSYVSSHVMATLNLFTINQFPFFDSLLAVVALPGVGWMLWRWRDPRHMAVLGWIGGILLIGGMITQYPPNVPRLIGVLPVACAIPAIVAGRVRGLFGQLMPARADYIVVPLLALWLTASAYRNWELEFILRSGEQLGDQMTNVCHAIARTPLPCTTYTMGSLGDIDTGISPLDCMMRTDVDRQAVRRSDDPALFPIRPSNKGSALFVFGREQSGLLSVLQHYYPLANYETVLSRDKAPHLWTATLSTDLIDRNRGLRVMWRDGNALREAERGRDVIGCEDCTAFPVEATASGLIYAAEPGKYAFRAPRGAVELNGSGLAPDEERELPAGWHQLKVTTTLGSSSERCQLQWRQPGAPDWQKVPREYLHRHPARHGLLGRYFTESLPLGNPKPSTSPAAYEQIVPALSFDINPERDEPPPPGFASKGATMEWSGTVQFPEGDAQSLRLETTSPARVFVNGVEVLASDESTAVVKDVTLTGLGPRAEILVRTVREADPPVWFWWMRLLWRQSGGDWISFADYEPPA